MAAIPRVTLQCILNYLARLLNSLDHITGGRIAFNVITSMRRDFDNYRVVGSACRNCCIRHHRADLWPDSWDVLISLDP